MFFGKNIHSISQRKRAFIRQQIGFIWQDLKLIEQKTIFENIALPLTIKKMSYSDIKEKVNRVLKDTGLYQYRLEYPNSLPHGICQKVSVVRAFIHDPKIILADEPMAFSDTETELEIWEMLNRYKTPETTIIFSTSQKYVIDAFNGNLIRINDGFI